MAVAVFLARPAWDHKKPKDCWGAEPDGWASHELNHLPLFQAMMQATGIGSGKSVLDIGCGAGHSTEMIKTANAVQYAADLGIALQELKRVGKSGGPFGLSAPGVLEESFDSAGIEVVDTGEVNCPFKYQSWDQFWRGTRAAGPTQMAIGLAGHDVVQAATRQAVEPIIAEDGSISFDTNMFIFVVGQA